MHQSTKDNECPVKCPNCQSDEFYYANQFFVCYKCKEHFGKAQFEGTVFKAISNNDFDPSYVLRAK